MEDLWSWTRSLSEGKLVDPKLLERAWTPYAAIRRQIELWLWLGNQPRARKPRRAMDPSQRRDQRIPIVGIWVPERKLFVAVLSNAMGGRPDPGLVSRRLALEAWAARPSSTSR